MRPVKREGGGWRDIDAILEEVTQAPDTLREAILDRACRGDAELKAEVESLLRHVEPAETMFSDLSSRLSGGPERETANGDVPVEAPTFVGRYRLTRRLPGGMSLVHEAWDPVEERRVVVKVALQGRDPRADERIAHEGDSGQTLDHPNICRVLDRGRTDAGRPFLVLEYAEGETLDEVCGDRGPLPAAEVVSLGRQVASGLAGAHALGVIHRDVKPANLMVGPDGAVKILDFGSAKSRGARALTAQGVVLGTPLYMSPEQLRGDKLRPATDVWSLAVVLVECLQGAHPFAGGSRRQTLMNVLHRAAVIRSAGWEQLSTGQRTALEAALSKDPGGRPAASEIESALS